MTYRILSPSLHSTANAARKFFSKHFGISNFQIEIPVEKDSAYITTLTGQVKNFQKVCIEVRETAEMPQALEQFVFACSTNCLEVNLYMALPKGTEYKDYEKHQRHAKKYGVGIVEVDEKGGEVVLDAVPLSLAGLRRIKVTEFPKKYRLDLTNAERTFLSGNPTKGCSELFDLIEDLTRKLAKEAIDNGFWPNSPSIKIEKDPWANVLKEMMKGIDYAIAKKTCPQLTDTFLAKIIGITSERNETAHKPKTNSELVKRNRKLRTRFENANDIFLELIEVVKPLKV